MTYFLFQKTDIKKEYLRHLSQNNAIYPSDHHCYLVSLPNELWSMIMAYMDIETYASLPSVCSYFYFMIRDRIIGVNGNYRIVGIQCTESPLTMSIQFNFSHFGMAFSRSSLSHVTRDIFHVLSIKRIFIIRTYEDLMLFKNITIKRSPDCFFESSGVLRSGLFMDTRENIMITSDIYTTSLDSFIYRVRFKKGFDEEYVVWKEYPEVVKEIERKISSIVPVHIIIDNTSIIIKKRN